MSNYSIIKLLKEISHHLVVGRRTQSLTLIVLIIFSSLAEMLSISTIIPFLSLLTSPDKILDYGFTKNVVSILGLSTQAQILLVITIIFLVAILMANFIRILLIWVTIKFSYSVGAEFSLKIYSRTLYQPYLTHCSRNSSEVLDGVLNKSSCCTSALNQIINMVSSCILLLVIVSTLLFINPLVTAVVFLGFAVIYILITKITSNKLFVNSQVIARDSVNSIRSLQEGLGGIRDLIIDNTQELYIQIYQKSDLALRQAQSQNQFMNISPRYVMEALCMSLLITSAYYLVLGADDPLIVIPILGVIGFGAIRMLPILQAIYFGWSTILSMQESLQQVLILLNQPINYKSYQPVARALAFNQHIELKEISFQYNPQMPLVLKKINLSIPKGARIGFIGVTGVGKSTLIDIVMGLLEPTTGSLSIDNQIVTSTNSRDWQLNLSHVPQTIFLADSTIKENIAFGVPIERIDLDRVFRAAQSAQIASTIETFPEKYETTIGERGIRLSGGQRQRIGIARALYKKSDVIIFDEATSSLDNETEYSLMEAINNLSNKLTILIVAHRLSTLKNCGQIFELEGGLIKRICSYDDIIGDVKVTTT
jgi:ABC-type bacteriocin/lantibiotic exporter with double-glycine peptidase domain